MPEIAIEPRPGDSVGPYRITRTIGRGRMGVVFEGVEDGGDAGGDQGRHDRALAGRGVRPPLQARSRRRAEDLAPATWFPCWTRARRAACRTSSRQLIPGGSLARPRSPTRARWTLATTVAAARAAPPQGIDALHASGLVHRDIKPANILLDGDTAYVTDFGLAKDSQASNLTRPGQALGSLDYMAPEQIRGEEVSAATDIYALGCVIHECLTGTPPFGGRPSMRVLFAHLQEPPPDLSEAARRHQRGDGEGDQPGAGEGAGGPARQRAGYIAVDRARGRHLAQLLLDEVRRVGLRLGAGHDRAGVVDARRRSCRSPSALQLRRSRCR